MAHGTFGLLIGLVGLYLPLLALRDLSFPLWWWAVPADDAGPQLGWWTATNWSNASAVSLLGVGWVLLTALTVPALRAVQSWPGRWFLRVDSDVESGLRIARLTESRAAALDAHTAELRRIERALHDGTQNRLVAVTMLLGAARRALEREDVSALDAGLARSQEAAEAALAELRHVVRGILPPVLADRGLQPALTGLAAGSPVPVRLEVALEAPVPTAVAATAYFVVAEALTNVARHAGATGIVVRASIDRWLVRIEVCDDGVGGALERGASNGGGSGLAGIRRRVEALDGTFALNSPTGGPTRVAVELPCES